MIKILLGKGLEQTITQCKFCGEFGKECVKGSVPFKWITETPRVGKYELYAKLDVRRVFKIPVFGRPFYKVSEEDEQYGYLWDGHTRDIEEYKDDSYICKDCIKQLAILIKN